ncbi:putative HTH-type transcriptional regulator ArcR [Halalkalicoccus paucihalophilus]|uniref:Putative HTH-type transcriptional regulator ArcR n=2 Tax=Halalkalicoccus paucihalophilus TaxID=1008153 RepID=A0A151AAT1_9EURY|nr:IclR family transcriptional regulator [Halalkalicoccus paucihalophilus]KYH24729.1 putative HTH-type transcriptional regulator ArcR [Halalkalicoccus paucihalophilus]
MNRVRFAVFVSKPAQRGAGVRTRRLRRGGCHSVVCYRLLVPDGGEILKQFRFRFGIMPPSDTTSEPRTLTTVLNAIDILRALMHLDSAGVTELANHLGESKSTTYTYLKSLEKGGLVTQIDNDYRLSYDMLIFGEYVRNQSSLYTIGRDEIDSIATETGQYAHLVVEKNGRGHNLYKSKGEQAVGDDYQMAKFQQRDYLHITASGKAILAYLPRERVEEIVDQHGLPARTERTITSKERLFEELADIREQGYSQNDEEEIEGFQAIGAPIRSREGAVLGSISVSGPKSMFGSESEYQKIVDLVVKTANVVEVNVNMSKRSSEIIQDTN